MLTAPSLNISALLDQLLPSNSLKDIHHVFKFNEKGELSLRESLMLWKRLIKIYFPYMTIPTKVNHPNELMEIFIQERQNYENFDFRKWNVNEKIHINLILLALSGDLNALKKTTLTKNAKQALTILAITNGHYHFYPKLDKDDKAKQKNEEKLLAIERMSELPDQSILLNFLNYFEKQITKGDWLIKFAIKNNQKTILDWFFENDDLKNDLDYCQKLFTYCAHYGYAGTLKYLLSKGAKIEFNSVKHQIIKAINRKDNSTFSALLQYCNQTNLNDMVCFAIDSKNLELFSHLIASKKFFPINKMITIFAQEEQIERVQFLQNHFPHHAANALWQAAEKNNYKVIKFLLENCPAIPLKDMERALNIVKINGNRGHKSELIEIFDEIIEERRAVHQGLTESQFLQYYQECWRNAALGITEQEDNSKNPSKPKIP